MKRLTDELKERYELLAREVKFTVAEYEMVIDNFLS